MRKLAVVASFVLILGGVAYASIPDAGGVIHGCYFTGGGGQVSGSLRVIDSPTQSCTANETALTWSQAGPQGPTGATGPSGLSGYQVIEGPHVFVSPTTPGFWESEGKSLIAPAGTLLLSGGYRSVQRIDERPPLVTGEGINPQNPQEYFALFVCERPTPCEVVLTIVVVDAP